MGNNSPFPSWFHADNVAFLGALGIAVGLPASNTVLSIGSIVLVVAALISVEPGVQIRRFIGNRTVHFFFIIFLLTLASWFLVADRQLWMQHVQIKLSLLSIPFAMSILPAFSYQRKTLILWFYILTTSLIAGLTLLGFVSGGEGLMDQVVKDGLVGLVIDRNHIYFSVIMAFSIWAALWIFQESDAKAQFFRKGSALGLAIFQLLALHVLSARTGLAAFYGTAFAFILYYSWVKARYLVGAGLIIALVLMPLVAYFSVSSFHERVDRTRIDVGVWLKGENPNNYSFATRMEAWKTAKNVFLRQPLTGCGIPELKLRMQDQYARQRSLVGIENQVQPHNQFLEYLAGMGWPGFLVFTIGFFAPLFVARYRESFLFMALWTIFLFSLFSESLLERQVGIAMLTFFWCLLPFPKEN